MLFPSQKLLALTIVSGFFLVFSSAVKVSSKSELLELAQTYAASITLPTPEEGGATRRLASLSNSEFREKICDPFKEGFVSSGGPGATCSCTGPSRYSVTCRAPNLGCVTPDECGGDQEICEDRTVLTQFRIVGNTLYVSDLTIDSDFSGADYEGQRTRVWGINNKQCETIFKFNGTHYKCNECTVCSNDNISMDCSNVHSSSTTNGECLDFETTELEYGILTGFCVADEIIPTGGEIPVTELSGATGYSNNLAIMFGMVLLGAFF